MACELRVPPPLRLGLATACTLGRRASAGKGEGSPPACSDTHAAVRRAPPSSPSHVLSSARREGIGPETGNKVWDPLGLADLGSPATLRWMRHAELKHSRVCMAAFCGWLVAVSGIHFPGDLSFSEGVSFEDLSKLGPLEQWSAIPQLGKMQILLAIGIIEHQSEWKTTPHSMAVRDAPSTRPLHPPPLLARSARVGEQRRRDGCESFSMLLPRPARFEESGRWAGVDRRGARERGAAAGCCRAASFAAGGRRGRGRGAGCADRGRRPMFLSRRAEFAPCLFVPRAPSLTLPPSLLPRRTAALRAT